MHVFGITVDFNYFWQSDDFNLGMSASKFMRAVSQFLHASTNHIRITFGIPDKKDIEGHIFMLNVAHDCTIVKCLLGNNGEVHPNHPMKNK